MSWKYLESVFMGYITRYNQNPTKFTLVQMPSLSVRGFLPILNEDEIFQLTLLKSLHPFEILRNVEKDNF